MYGTIASMILSFVALIIALQARDRAALLRERVSDLEILIIRRGIDQNGSNEPTRGV